MLALEFIFIVMLNQNVLCRVSNKILFFDLQQNVKTTLKFLFKISNYYCVYRDLMFLYIFEEISLKRGIFKEHL